MATYTMFRIEEVFRETLEVVSPTTEVSLRDNMVSGIEDLKMTADAIQPPPINGVHQENRNEISTKLNGTTEKHNSQSSSSSGSQTGEPANDKINTNTDIQSSMEVCQTEVVFSPVDVRTGQSVSGKNQNNPREIPGNPALDVHGPTVNVERAFSNEQDKPVVMIGVKRKRTESDDLKPPNAPRKKKLQQTSSSVDSEKKQPPDDISTFATDYSHNNGTGTGAPLPLRSASALPFAQTQHVQKCNARRLLPMKIDCVFSCKVNTKREVGYVLEVDNKGSTGNSSVLRCSHEIDSFHGLEWSIATESPVCGVVGDVHRIIAICEDFTVHVLDLKGRYVFPPILIPSHASKISQNGAYLMIITVKASLHVWNIHSKKIHIKSETILPLLNQPGHDPGSSVDVSYASVMMSGVPMLILSNGKTFVFSLDMQTWMMISDPCAPAKPNPMRGDGILRQEPLFTPARKRTGNLQHSAITAIKLKLASAMELRKSADVRKWIVILAKSLANYDLRQELHQLCEDLLGPTHSSAQSSNSTVSTVLGVDKRDLLREILSVLLEDLRWQDFYCEFSDLLALADSTLTGQAPAAQETHNGIGN